MTSEGDPYLSPKRGKSESEGTGDAGDCRPVPVQPAKTAKNGDERGGRDDEGSLVFHAAHGK